MGSYNSNSMSTQRAKVKSLEENFMDEKNYPVIASIYRQGQHSATFRYMISVSAVVDPKKTYLKTA